MAGRKKKDAPPSRVWIFGCGEPVDGAELVRDQLFETHRYRNDLARHVLNSRQVYREARSEICRVAALEQEHLEAKEALDVLRQEQKAWSAAARRRVQSPELQQAIKDAKQKKRDVLERLKQAREEVEQDPELQQARAEINKRAAAEKKRLYNESPAVWGSRLRVDESWLQMRWGRMDPKFRRFDGSGRVVVQIQKGMSVAQAFECKDTRFQLARPTRDWDRRTGRRGGTRTMFRIRVGSEGKRRTPVWATFPVTLHRELPEDAQIKWVEVRAVRQGPDLRFQLHLTLEWHGFDPRSRGAGAVSIVCGWRAMHDGTVCVGRWIDDSGRSDVLVLPADVGEAEKHASSLRSISDLHFDAARRVFKSRRHLLPAWVTEESAYLDKWRSHARLAKIVGRLTAEILGDEAAHVWRQWRRYRQREGLDLHAPYEELSTWLSEQGEVDPARQTAFYLEWWRRKNRHLHRVECNVRTKALRRRKAIYRNWAASFARRYETVLVDDFDLRQFARNAAPEEDARQDYLHGVMRLAAPGELRLAFLHSLGGARAVKVPATEGLRRCYLCGSPMRRPDRSGTVEHDCGVITPWQTIRGLDMLRGAGVDTVAAEQKLLEGHEAMKKLFRELARKG